MTNKKHFIPYAFLVLGICFGAIFTALTPPFQAPDESAHFFRAYQLSLGRMNTVVFCELPMDHLPQGLSILVNASNAVFRHGPFPVKPRDILEALNRIPPGETNAILTGPIAIYPPLAHAPQVAGVAIGRMLHASPLALMYLGRLANLLVFLALVFFALRRLPVGRLGMAVFALMPMTLYLAGSLSSDAIATGLVFYYVSLVCSLSFRQEGVTLRHVLGLVMVSMLLAVSKPGYFLLSGLFFMIPPARFKNMRHYALAFATVFLTFLSPLAWMYCVRNQGMHIPNVDALLQIRFVLEHPLDFARVLLESLWCNKAFYAASFIGCFGWLDIDLPGGVLIAYAVCAVTASSANTEGVSVGLKQRMIALAVCMGSGIMIMTLLYLAWTPVAAPLVQGVQGRYFIPLAALFSIIMGSARTGSMLTVRPGDSFICALFACSAAFLSVSAHTIYMHYYG